MSDAHRVYLVPGFFGFSSIGSVSYFQGVAPLLTTLLAERGVAAEVLECPTQPTASIARRAIRVLDKVRDTGGLEAAQVHFIGHSTGGLDVRLLTTPGVQLCPDRSENTLRARTRSVTTVAAPHFGTPVANFFTTLPGRQFLMLLAAGASTSGGRASIFWAAKALDWVARLDDWMGRRDTFLDALAQGLLRQLDRDPTHPVWAFFQEVARDQGAVIQLTPESMHLFNAAVVDDPKIAYSSVVTAAPPPPFSFQGYMLRSLPRLGLATGFAMLHTIAAQEHRHYPYPHPGEDISQNLAVELPFRVHRGTNDGIVPTLSQVHGDILGAVVSDHLDVVGQFHRGTPHSDWMPSGSNFDAPRFARVWRWVADAIARASKRPASRKVKRTS